MNPLRVAVVQGYGARKAEDGKTLIISLEVVVRVEKKAWDD